MLQLVAPTTIPPSLLVTICPQSTSFLSCFSFFFSAMTEPKEAATREAYLRNKPPGRRSRGTAILPKQTEPLENNGRGCVYFTITIFTTSE